VVMRHRQAVGVVAVDADAAPVPARPVVPGAPVVGRVRVVAVPAGHQRSGRAPVVDPVAQLGAVVDEIAVDVVVPAARPPDLGIGLDGLGIGVHVGDDRDLGAVGEGLVADHALVAGLLHDVLDVDLVVGARLGDDGAGRGVRVGRGPVVTRRIAIGAPAGEAQARRHQGRPPELPCTRLHRHEKSLHREVRPFKTWIPRGIPCCGESASPGFPPTGSSRRRWRSFLGHLGEA